MRRPPNCHRTALLSSAPPELSAQRRPPRSKIFFEKLSKYTPIGRMCQPKEVAALAYYLACDEAAMLTGTCYNVRS